MNLKRILSVSQSAITPDREAFKEAIGAIMAESHINNAADGITGVLMYDRGRFVQLVEGPPAVIDALIERLRLDARHVNFSIRLAEACSTRRLPDWSMVLINVTETPSPSFPTADLDKMSASELIDLVSSAAENDTILRSALRTAPEIEVRPPAVEDG